MFLQKNIFFGFFVVVNFRNLLFAQVHLHLERNDTLGAHKHKGASMSCLTRDNRKSRHKQPQDWAGPVRTKDLGCHFFFFFFTFLNSFFHKKETNLVFRNILNISIIQITLYRTSHQPLLLHGLASFWKKILYMENLYIYRHTYISLLLIFVAYTILYFPASHYKYTQNVVDHFILLKMLY